MGMLTSLPFFNIILVQSKRCYTLKRHTTEPHWNCEKLHARPWKDEVLSPGLSEMLQCSVQNVHSNFLCWEISPTSPASLLLNTWLKQKQNSILIISIYAQSIQQQAARTLTEWYCCLCKCQRRYTYPTRIQPLKVRLHFTIVLVFGGCSLVSLALFLRCSWE